MNRQSSASHTLRLAAIVRTRRRGLHLSQGEVADLAQCSERAVRDLEHGAGMPRLDTVLQILGALGLGLEVINGSGELIVADGL